MPHAHSSINQTRKPKPKLTGEGPRESRGYFQRGSCKRTCAEPGNLFDVAPGLRIGNLLRNELHDPRGNHVDGKPKRRRVQEKFVHEHVSGHDDGEEYKENDSRRFGISLRLVKGQDAMEQRCRKKMHRQLVGCKANM